jgi:heme/copper-type cytochrome/quinol oxidase subunit 2
MFRDFVYKNISLISIIIFLILFGLIVITKPDLIFDKNGKPREFGLGYKNKTIVPIWLAVIIFAILSYLSVLYYINYDRLVF